MFERGTWPPPSNVNRVTRSQPARRRPDAIAAAAVAASSPAIWRHDTDAEPGTFDDLEGLSVWRDRLGKLRATTVADNNFSLFFTTQIVEFALVYLLLVGDLVVVTGDPPERCEHRVERRAVDDVLVGQLEDVGFVVTARRRFVHGHV